MKTIKVMQNDVSLFFAGYKAALADQGWSTIKIEEADYTTTEFGNNVRKLLNAYTSKETDDEGLEEMYKVIYSK